MIGFLLFRKWEAVNSTVVISAILTDTKFKSLSENNHPSLSSTSNWHFLPYIQSSSEKDETSRELQWKWICGECGGGWQQQYGTTWHEFFCVPFRPRPFPSLWSQMSASCPADGLLSCGSTCCLLIPRYSQEKKSSRSTLCNFQALSVYNCLLNFFFHADDS